VPLDSVATRPEGRFTQEAGGGAVTAGAMEGFLVLDFTTLLPGPLATQLMQQAGARVVKVERPGGGDDLRGYQPRLGATAVAYTMLNQGKEILELDLKAGDR
jgi:crotonobetainyl-CoA:carnitine CoA-transferase CaiB-like acyl-CoA transferase